MKLSSSPQPPPLWANLFVSNQRRHPSAVLKLQGATRFAIVLAFILLVSLSCTSFYYVSNSTLMCVCECVRYTSAERERERDVVILLVIYGSLSFSLSLSL